MTVVSDDNLFEWDSEKNESNKKKHGIDFEKILAVFDDPFFLERIDTDHSTGTETRYFGLGNINGIIVIALSYTDEKRIRIISARLATPREEKIYEDNIKRING